MIEKIQKNPELLIGLTLIVSFLSMIFVNFLIIFFIFLWAFYFVNKYRKDISGEEFKRSIIAGLIVLFWQPSLGIMTFFASLASQILSRNRVNATHFFDGKRKNERMKTLIIIFLLGSVLGFLNLFLSGQWDITTLPEMSYRTFYFPIAIAVFEEVFFRNFLYILYIYFLPKPAFVLNADILGLYPDDNTSCLGPLTFYNGACPSSPGNRFFVNLIWLANGCGFETSEFTFCHRSPRYG